MPKPTQPQSNHKPTDGSIPSSPSTTNQSPALRAVEETKRPTDSVPMISGTFANLPMRFGRYQVKKLLGRGAMGAVYLAEDTQLEREVALKIPKLSGSGAAKLLQRLKTEAKAAAQIEHPCLCPVYDTGEIDGTSFIAMQYIEGDTLKDVLEKQQPKTPQEAVALVIHLAEGLAEAHVKGIYHRDLKPENIKLNRRGLPVIMDFGLAKLTSTLSTDAGKTQRGAILGSPAYMSPEQASGKLDEIDQRSDIYALGVILYEMLTGQRPFSGSALQVMGQKSVVDAPSVLTINAELDSQLAAVCDKMIAKQREERYQTAQEVVVALKEIETGDKPATAAGSSSSWSVVPPVLAEIPVFELDEYAPPPIVTRNRRRPQRRAKSPGLTEGVLGTCRSIADWWHGQSAALRWSVLGGAGAVLLFAAIVLSFRTKEGTLILEVNEPGAEVFVDGERVTVKWDGGQKEATVGIRPGERLVEIKKKGYSVAGKTLLFKEGERTVFKAQLKPEPDDKPRRPSVSETLPSRADQPSPNPDVDTTQSVTSTETIGVSQWVDLLAWSEGVNWEPLGYNWNQYLSAPPSRQGILLNGMPHGRFPIPAIIDGSFEVEAEFVRQGGNDCVEVFFPVGTHNMHLVLSGWPHVGKADGVDGFQWIDGREAVNNPTTRRPSRVRSNQKHKILLQVKHMAAERVQINVDMDDVKNYITWEGAAAALVDGNPPGGPWNLSTVQNLWVGSRDAPTTFSKLRIRMLTGSIRRDVISEADRQADRTKGLVRLVGEQGRAVSVGAASFMVNQLPSSLQGSLVERLWPLATPNCRRCTDYYGAHAPSRLKIPIPSSAKTFTVFGVNEASRDASFIVEIDGKKLYESRATELARINVPIPEKAALMELVVDPLGSNAADQTYWCYPRFHSVSVDHVTDEMRSSEVSQLRFEVASHTVGAGKFSRNEPMGKELPFGPLHFADLIPCHEFLCAHAASTVTYQVPKGMTRFTAVGYNMWSQHTKFEVWADGKRLYQSPTVGVVQMDVKLPADTHWLELKVDPLGDISSDTAMWCFPRLHRE